MQAMQKLTVKKTLPADLDLLRLIVSISPYQHLKARRNMTLFKRFHAAMENHLLEHVRTLSGNVIQTYYFNGTVVTGVMAP
ncbi:hypothetical protein [Pseudomonas sp. WS 5413]|uniref:hypothetical protein n=1 Tax=Pseudomonas sp. WS 5413 TaxID=2717488 RepID=UPI001475E8AA|nr:hypothetical protein [Pseudomonas sp. WS 5413]NMX32506.1 hypothetical protein [Pseudomonas sp. WS 5413]